VINANDVVNNWSASPAEQLRQAEELVAKALALNPKHAVAHLAQSTILVAQKKPEQAVGAAETAIALNRNLAPAYGWIGYIKTTLGRAEETIAYVQQALRLSPRDPMRGIWLRFIGKSQLFLGRDNEAIDSLRNAVIANSKLSFPYLWLAAAYALAGREAEARGALVEFNRLDPNWTIEKLKADAKAQSDNPTFLTQHERLYDGLRRAGMPEE
jgi:tetratricopeptide (TPR) repeat protein